MSCIHISCVLSLIFLPVNLSLSLSIGFHPVKLELLRLKTNLKKNKNNHRKCAIFGFHCLIRCEDHKGLLLVWSGAI